MYSFNILDTFILLKKYVRAAYLLIFINIIRISLIVEIHIEVLNSISKFCYEASPTTKAADAEEMK